jgi:hypothetical protein
MEQKPPGGASASGPRELHEVVRIELPGAHWRALQAHAHRKLEGRWLSGETPEPQAFGLLGGRIVEDAIRTREVFPLLRNLRGEEREGAQIDAVVSALATPSKTPLRRRGWLADSREVLEVHRRCDAAHDLVYGSYHMHKVSWPHDPLRDTPTALDTALGEGQGIWMLILSMVDPRRPLLRAFFEGDVDREVPVVFL